MGDPGDRGVNVAAGCGGFLFFETRRGGKTEGKGNRTGKGGMEQDASWLV